MSQHDIKWQIEFFEAVLARNGKYVDVIELLGGLYTRVGRIDDGLRMDRRLIRLEPENPLANFNLACSLSLKKRFKESFEFLQKAIELGYQDWSWLMEDPDLEALRNHPRYEAFFDSVRERLGEFEDEG